MIQQDGAPAHMLQNDEEFAAAANQQRLNVKLYTQPANSPDLNVLDLGLFRALQSANDEAPEEVEDLIQSVLDTYEGYEVENCNFIWLSLQMLMNAIIQEAGNNKYKLGHMNKKKKAREGTLETAVKVCDEGMEILLRESLQMENEEDTAENHYQEAV